MKKIILASGSPRRKKLLTDAGIKFDVDVSDYEEDMTLDLSPHELAEYLSAGKARAVAKRHKDAVIVAADTFVVFENKILGKPYTKKKARKMLKKLSGNTHSVITGFTIIDTATGEIISEAHESRLTLRDISSEEIDKYVNSGEPLDKAGAYAIQGGAAHFVKKLEGEFTTIVGFPMEAFLEKLKQVISADS